ncbi:secreted RxLR effector protein 161-like [Elaeis guineensis]|uniref:secreted RxLR effector protein 161-like n=1 Tax=Elaeis guineensis var. tenera TaxID=51953 RepID=UPI003C6D883B
MLGCKPATTPINQNHRTVTDGGASVDQKRYQRLVGRLIYLSHTRPDIAYAVSVISQYMHDPRESHMERAFRVLCYLKGCPGRGLLFSQHNTFQVERFTDADWAGSLDDRRSISGYCTYVGGNLVIWRSKKQSVVARSSAEAEYRAMALGIYELLWLQKLLQELQLLNKFPLRLYCDNKAAIEIVSNPIQHDRTKHIEIDRHFIKEKINQDQICITYIRSSDQVADILTKGLSSLSFSGLIDKMGLRDIFASS